MPTTSLPVLTKKDFETSQDVRWCPGCGDYSVLATVQRFLPSQAVAKENYVFVSGIGCSSRFPYYMETYGFHSIHGRAPAIATGVKIANPSLDVWMVTGDGDCLSIGGNHILHLLRRNVDLNVLLLNNRIYGLTKGQYSPTSEIGKVTGSSPFGSLDYPLNPLLIALGAQATFVARTLDKDAKHMTTVLEAAVAHRGTSFIEIYQNCNIFNDGAFDYMSERENRLTHQLQLIDGEPLIFGAEREKGIALSGLHPKVVTFEPGNTQAALAAGVIIYDKHSPEMAHLMARLKYPEFPVPVGVFYTETRPTYDALMREQHAAATKRTPLTGDVNINLTKLFSSGETWVVN